MLSIEIDTDWHFSSGGPDFAFELDNEENSKLTLIMPWSGVSASGTTNSALIPHKHFNGLLMKTDNTKLQDFVGFWVFSESSFDIINEYEV